MYVVSSELTFGRDNSCEIRTVDPRVSRKHALIRADQDGITVQDLGSNNDTFLNGKKIAQATLCHGDEIHFGGIEFVVIGSDNADAITRLNTDSIADADNAEQ